MNERSTVIVEGVQKSNTAELRDRFESINQLVAQGYNHKKVCEYLNTQGTAISYSYYRVIMTRPRSERATLSPKGADITIMARQPDALRPIAVDPRATIEIEHRGRLDSSRQLTWNAGADVKWK